VTLAPISISYRSGQQGWARSVRQLLGGRITRMARTVPPASHFSAAVRFARPPLKFDLDHQAFHGGDLRFVFLRCPDVVLEGAGFVFSDPDVDKVTG
jgi:hypothetical protein